MERFAVGSLVQLVQQPPYLKTADPMPMLRSADVVQVGETGRVVGVRPLGTYSVQFTNGVFLVDQKYLTPLGTGPEHAESQNPSPS
ncbi:MAG: DUF3148 domain-containing protein [Synechococcaceae cyanobacterium SM2_3_1]|nr:DUF3148 domain-containing protein [Synechococcaceae cyanobacterium SM2_3_1]